MIWCIQIVPTFASPVPMNAESALDEILALLASGASVEGGPGVSLLDRALQRAELAQKARASDDLLVAALLGDVGVLLTPGPGSGSDPDRRAAAFLRERGLSERVVELVSARRSPRRPDSAASESEFAQLRRWDAEGRRPSWKPPDLACYRELLLRALRIGAARRG